MFSTKSPAPLALSLLFISTISTTTKTHAEEVNLKPHNEFPAEFETDTDKKVGIYLEGNDVMMYSDHFNTQYLGELPDKEEREYTDALALEGDFNFDGYQDIALFEGSGYGGVNQFYRLMLWDKSKGEFKPFQTSVGLPSLNTKKQTLVSAQRSGPRWYSSVFHFKDGKLVQRDEEAMIDGELSKVEIYDGKDKLLKTLITDKDDYTLDTPTATRNIRLEKAWLYNKPDFDSKTKMYVIKGDKVELLDFKNEMFLMKYKGKKTITKWIESEAVIEW
jgi:hypothetical protein